MSYITVENLSLGYDSYAIVEGLQFTVDAGDYLCIVGENGSGKSTLMKTLLHLQEPVAGRILLGDGLKISEIGYLPQQTLVQRDFPASVAEIVLSGCQGRCGLRPFYNKEEKKLARDNMQRMGISDLAERCYRELSGGQQQRVLLARALCATRKILLLDEPVSGLDPKVTAEMYSLIEDLNREGITIIMISHDISAAVRYASHILHIGRHIFYGTKEAYLKSDVGQFFLRQEAYSRTDNVRPAQKIDPAAREVSAFRDGTDTMSAADNDSVDTVQDVKSRQKDSSERTDQGEHEEKNGQKEPGGQKEKCGQKKGSEEREQSKYKEKNFKKEHSEKKQQSGQREHNGHGEQNGQYDKQDAARKTSGEEGPVK